MENRLSYQEFQESLRRQVSKELNCHGTYQCKITQSQKNNVLVSGLSIKREGTHLAAVIYLEDSYQSYLQGKSLEKISQELTVFYQNQELPDIDGSVFTEYEKVKDMLRVRLVSRENNQAYYSQGPFKMHPMGAVVLFIELQRNEEGVLQTQVTNVMAERWKVPQTTLFETALENTQSQNKAKLDPIMEVVNEIISDKDAGIQETLPMYVLSNERREFGAAVMLYPDVLKQVQNQLGEDYYILPSSIHETIVLPKSKVLDIKGLRSMVREINETMVDPKEILGNEVFEYKGSTGKVKKCVKEDRER